MDLLTYFNLKEGYELPTKLLEALLAPDSHEVLCDAIMESVA